jgi:hypothetical protein
MRLELVGSSNRGGQGDEGERDSRTAGGAGGRLQPAAVIDELREAERLLLGVRSRLEALLERVSELRGRLAPTSPADTAGEAGMRTPSA